MKKTEVYSWRVSRNTKAALEEAARRRHASVSEVLDEIVGSWLESEGVEAGADDEEQARLHARVAQHLGAIAGANPDRASNVSALVRERMRKRAR